MNDHPASWRMPNPKQMENLARNRDHRVPKPHPPAPDQPLPAEWWDSVLADPRAAGKPWLPIEQRRLSEVPRELLRVEGLRCTCRRRSRFWARPFSVLLFTALFTSDDLRIALALEAQRRLRPLNGSEIFPPALAPNLCTSNEQATRRPAYSPRVGFDQQPPYIQDDIIATESRNRITGLTLPC